MNRNLIFFSIIFLNLIFLLFYQQKEISQSTKIIIKPGMQLQQISEILYEKGLIENKIIFIVWTKLNFSEKKLKFGEYSFDQQVSINSILKKIKEGKSLNRKLTIVEGWSNYELLDLINNLDVNHNLNPESIPEEIIANTYFYQVSDNAEEIIRNIRAKSLEVIEELWRNRDKSIPIKNISEMFTLASIIEKETSIESEKSIIAGVFYNRIKKNMKLQSDPTVVFAITQGKKKMGRKLLRKDLKFKSKYNTYMHKGLPPTPICIPGLQSLEATVNPVESNYLYFVSKNKKDEGHVFSVNYKEHLRNINLIRKSKDSNE